MRVVAIFGLVLDVGGGDGDAAGLLFRGVIDGVEGSELDLRVVLGQDFGDRRRERRFAVIDVADGADVDVRFAAIKLLFSHNSPVSKPATICTMPAWCQRTCNEAGDGD